MFDKIKICFAQKLKEGKLQDLGKMISEHQKQHPSRRIFQTNMMGERPIGPRLDSYTRTSLEEQLIDTGQLPANSKVCNTWSQTSHA
eukprot:COSAG05_NODE_71_length_22071_cov_17.527149_4_plen_87_part_00